MVGVEIEAGTYLSDDVRKLGQALIDAAQCADERNETHFRPNSGALGGEG
jgi:hypothetical protein